VSRTGFRARAVDFFIEPGEAPAAPGAGYLAPAAPRPRTATPAPLRAAVLGSAADASPTGALLANALRAAVGAPAAAVAVWAPAGLRPGGFAGAPPRRGPATFAARRLAARLTARGPAAVSRGRLAWLRLDDHPVAAAVAARRAAAALELPLVVVLAGPRCDVVEGLLAEQDLVIVVAREPDGPLARLAVGSCAAAALPEAPCPSGPQRWAALAGLSGARRLAAPTRDVVRSLAVPPSLEPEGVAW